MSLPRGIGNVVGNMLNLILFYKRHRPMKIRNNVCHVYDVEVCMNIFHVTIYDTEEKQLYKFEISQRRNHIHEICHYFRDPNKMIVGYNNQHYDDILIAYLTDLEERDEPWYQTCGRLYNLSQHLISTDVYDQVKRWKYMFLNKSLDLMTMLFSNKLRTGLKSVQVTMHYPNVLEFEHDWNTELDPKRFDELAEYNENDVMSTNQLLEKHAKDIELRISLEDKYNIRVLNKDNVNLGMEILKAEYLKYSGKDWNEIKDLKSPIDEINLKDVILPFIKYDTPILQKMLQDLKESTVELGRKTFEYTFIFDYLKYTIGIGGIHSVNDGETVVPAEHQTLADYDVASLYPSLLIEYEFYPRHLGIEFKECYAEIRTKRLEYKKLGMKLENESFKLALNGLTGNLQQPHSWVYDPFAVMQIRMNGQLLLMILAEKYVQAGIKIIQANTDGLFILYDSLLQYKVDKINKEWEELTHLVLEGDFFKGIYQQNVNSYFCIDKLDRIKVKGIFSNAYFPTIGKGLRPSIIPKAVIEFFQNGTPIVDTIKNCKDIKEFLMSEKTGSQFEVFYADKKQQRINRFYASLSGAYLYKRKKLSDGKFQYDNMLVGTGVIILNKFDNKPIEERKINYRYYIMEAYKLLTTIKPRQLSLW